MDIKTSNNWNYFKCSFEVPQKVFKERFSYLEADVVDGFINHNNNWFHISQFINCNDFDGWDGVNTYTENDFLLIKISSDKEKYKIGVYSK